MDSDQPVALTERSLIQSKLVYAVVGFLLSIVIAMATYSALDVKKRAENAESAFFSINVEVVKLREQFGASNTKMTEKITEAVSTMKEIQMTLGGHVEKTFELIKKSGEMEKEIEHLTELGRLHETRLQQLERRENK